jgi:hypothetical protein
MKSCIRAAIDEAVTGGSDIDTSHFQVRTQGRNLSVSEEAVAAIHLAAETFIIHWFEMLFHSVKLQS